jgi:DNA polymerase-3 subunit gamma/tau
MYQALYRKYRPTTFDDVVGQEVIVKTILNALKNNKVAHAYIFSGPRGTGKTSTAKIFAKALKCESESEIICNKCVSCTQINSKQSTDIIEIDAASNNGVDEIRELKNKVNNVPSIGKYKIYIIDEVHMLSKGAFNALLKTLEEPPAHAVFILATTEVHKVPETVLSRCQKFEFKKIGNQEMFKRIKFVCEQEHINADDNVITEIVNLSDGGLRNSISLLDQVNSYSDGKITLNDVHEINGSLNYREILDFIDDILMGNVRNILKKLELFSESGKSIVKISEEILLYFRNILLSKIDVNLVYNCQLYDKYNNVDFDLIMLFIEEINLSIQKLKESSDPKLAFELVLIKLCGKKIGSQMINSNDNIERKEVLEISKVDKNNMAEGTNQIEETVITEKCDVVEVVKFNEKLSGNNIQEKEGNVENNIANEDISEKVITNEHEAQEPEEELSKDELIRKIQKIRVENTLSKFDKRKLIEFRNKMCEINNYKNNDEYQTIVDLILDRTLKAVSDEYMIFESSDTYSVNCFIREIEKIEKLLNLVFGTNFKVVTISSEEWEVIKTEFNNKTKEYSYTNENNKYILKLNEIIKQEKNDEEDELKKMFGSCVVES